MSDRAEKQKYFKTVSSNSKKVSVIALIRHCGKTFTCGIILVIAGSPDPGARVRQVSELTKKEK